VNPFVDLFHALVEAVATSAAVIVVFAAAARWWTVTARRHGIVWRESEQRWVTCRASTVEQLRDRDGDRWVR
jgi:hypothetical protein